MALTTEHTPLWRSTCVWTQERRRTGAELHILYSSLNIIMLIKWRRVRREGHVAHKGEIRNVQILFINCEGNNLVWRSRLGWNNNIKVNHKDNSMKVGTVCMHLALDMGNWWLLVNISNKASGSIKVAEFLDQLQLYFWRIICAISWILQGEVHVHICIHVVGQWMKKYIWKFQTFISSFFFLLTFCSVNGCAQEACNLQLY